MRLDDIAGEHEAEAMVAGDSFELIVERVRRMVTAGRGMALAVREFTYQDRPPVVYSGLRLDADARSGGVWIDANERDLWCGVVLTRGAGGYDDSLGFGFGADIYRYSGNETAKLAWRRYEDGKGQVARSERRRNMTHIAFVGGTPGHRYTREDSITVSAWNDDGVCTEKVLGFDSTDGSWQS